MILNAADSTYESDDRRRGRDLNTRNEIVAFHSPSLLSCFSPRHSLEDEIIFRGRVIESSARKSIRVERQTDREGKTYRQIDR